MNRSIGYLFLCLVLVGPSFVYGQSEQDQSYFEYTKKVLKEDANQIFCMGSQLVQLPFHIKGKNLLNGMMLGAATGSLFLLDKSVKDLSLHNRSEFNDKIFKIDDYFNGRTGSYAATSLYIGGFLFKQHKIRLMGLHALETLFISGAITGLFKYSFGRRRPYAGESNTDFKVFRGRQAKYRSFPSGHTSNAFAFASVMALSLDNSWWKTGWYGAATLVGLARIYHNVHWISDTFLAALISYNVADFVVNNDVQQEKSFNFYPSLNGFKIRINF